MGISKENKTCFLSEMQWGQGGEATDSLHNGNTNIGLETFALSNLGKVEHPCNSEANCRNDIGLKNTYSALTSHSHLRLISTPK